MDYLIWLSLKTSHSNHHFTFNRKHPTRENWMKKRAKAIKSSPLFSWFFSVRLICPTSPAIESFFFVCRSEFIKPDNPINKQKPQKKKKKSIQKKEVENGVRKQNGKLNLGVLLLLQPFQWKFYQKTPLGWEIEIQTKTFRVSDLENLSKTRSHNQWAWCQMFKYQSCRQCFLVK